MSRKYLASLALAAALLLALGIFVRGRFIETEANAPPSEASALQQLSQEGQLRRMSGHLADRVADVAPLVEYLPDVGASGVRWPSGDSLITTRRGQPVVALRSPRPDSLRRSPGLDGDSLRRDWILAVGRRPDGRIISATGLSGGRAMAACGERDFEEYVVAFQLRDGFAGAGLFDLNGRLLGMVVHCGDRLVAITAREIVRSIAESASDVGRLRDVYGLGVASLDERARAYFGRDAGALVTDVRRSSVADLAGLRPGDVVVAAGTRVVSSSADLGIGSAIDSLTIARRVRGSARMVRLSLEDARLKERQDSADIGIGISPEPAGQAGIAIVTVKPGSPAHAAGLRAGDRLQSVGDEAVTSAAVASRLIAGLGGQPIFVVFERDWVKRGVLLPL